MGPRRKKSFFQRLTGITTPPSDAEYDSYDVTEDTLDEYAEPTDEGAAFDTESSGEDGDAYWAAASNQETIDEEGHLPIDMHETANDITIKTLVAGVSPQDLDISITREMVTIRGERSPRDTVTDGNYYYQELYWGKFSRTVVLPEEIEVEESEATERHGLLVLRLPKINKDRETKIRVKSE